MAIVAGKSMTYAALGTTWKVHRDLTDSPGLTFIQDYLSGYDFSELEWVTLKAGSWGDATYPEEETYGWTNAVAGYCRYPARTRSGLYRVNSRINTRLGWPALVYQRESPLYRTEVGTWPDVPDDCFTGRWYIDEKSGREWRRLIRRVWLQDEHEAIVYILAHEMFHLLRRTRQVPGKNVEIEADRYGVQVLEAYRSSANSNVTTSDTAAPPTTLKEQEGMTVAEAVTDTATIAAVADTETRCLECDMALSSARSRFCSDRCRWTFHNREGRHRSAAGREKTCEVCGKEFVAKRSDAKTCSPRCRQKARRQRTRSAE
jgi:hypothetical protein